MSPRRGAWPLWLVLAVLILLHFYLRPRLYAGRGAPDFLLLALLILAFRSRPGVAAVAGFLVGLVEDVLTPARFGRKMRLSTQRNGQVSSTRNADANAAKSTKKVETIVKPAPGPRYA